MVSRYQGIPSRSSHPVTGCYSPLGCKMVAVRRPSDETNWTTHVSGRTWEVRGVDNLGKIDQRELVLSLTEFVSTFGPLIGVLLGASASLAGTVIVLRRQVAAENESARRDAYLEFIDAVEELRLGLFDFFSQAQMHFTEGLEGTLDGTYKALDSLKSNRLRTISAHRRLKLFAPTHIMEIGEEALALALGSPEPSLESWRNNPERAKTDMETMAAHDSQIEDLINAFVEHCRSDLDFDD